MRSGKVHEDPHKQLPEWGEGSQQLGPARGVLLSVVIGSALWGVLFVTARWAWSGYPV